MCQAIRKHVSLHELKHLHNKNINKLKHLHNKNKVHVLKNAVINITYVVKNISKIPCH